MKTQIKNYSSKLFLTVAAALSILTGIAAAQMPGKYEEKRERFAERMSRQAVEAKSLAANKSGVSKSAAVSLANSDTFQNGKDFAMAMFDAEGIDEYEEAYTYTILDLVHLIDRLEGQPEAAKLQKTLKSVIRGTATGAVVKKDIETVSKAYSARQKVDRKWYFNAGQTSMNLMIATFMNEDANIKKNITALQGLIKTAPKGTAKEILDPMSALAKYIAPKTYTDEDYTAIFESVGSLMDAVIG